MTESYRRIPLDPDRRHLVFGDIHGRHETFRALLRQLDHDPARDVVYSVGDLIDRGPDSVAVVEFFEQAHCHVVRGNHEQMAISPGEWHDVWLYPQNGGPATLASIERHGRDFDWLAAFCRRMPIVLDVGDDDQPGAFRLVHAESPFDWSERELREFLAGSSIEEAGESRLLWGREDVGRALDHREGATGGPPVAVHRERSTRAVFCGHTPLATTVTVAGTSWIDTWAGGFMTCIEPATRREYHQPFAVADELA